jgi:hypothetical protein
VEYIVVNEIEQLKKLAGIKQTLKEADDTQNINKPRMAVGDYGQYQGDLDSIRMPPADMSVQAKPPKMQFIKTLVKRPADTVDYEQRQESNATEKHPAKAKEPEEVNKDLGKKRDAEAEANWKRSEKEAGRKHEEPTAGAAETKKGVKEIAPKKEASKDTTKQLKKQEKEDKSETKANEREQEGAEEKAEKKEEKAEKKEEKVEETKMPAGVIKQKQKIANMSDAEKKEYFKGKSKADLEAMAWRHGYGKGSQEYAKHVTEATEAVKEATDANNANAPHFPAAHYGNPASDKGDPNKEGCAYDAGEGVYNDRKDIEKQDEITYQGDFDVSHEESLDKLLKLAGMGKTYP